MIWALETYQKAAQLDPTLPEIHLALALIYLEQKNYDEGAKGNCVGIETNA